MKNCGKQMGPCSSSCNNDRSCITKCGESLQACLKGCPQSDREKLREENAAAKKKADDDAKKHGRKTSNDDQ
jgi:hypothetical protein